MATQTKSDKGTTTEAVAEDTMEHLQEAKEHLKDAASAGCKAAVEARTAAGAEMDELLDKGRDMLCEAQGLIRKHPVAAFGVAFAAGWVLARLTRR